MTALQRAFSRHEKIRRMQANLEEIKKNGKVDADTYTQLKTQYEVLLDSALENLRAIRNQIKEQRQQAQETLDKLQADSSSISIRGKVGELSPEKVAAELNAIQSKVEACADSIQQCDRWLAARSSVDVGGYVDVDANETIGPQPPPFDATGPAVPIVPVEPCCMNLRIGLTPEPRNFVETLQRSSSIGGFGFCGAFALCFYLHRYSHDISLMHAYSISGFCGLSLMLWAFIFLERLRATVQFSDKKDFASRLNMATSQLGYNATSLTGDFLTLKPSFQTGGVALGMVSVQLEDDHAVIVGPKMHVTKIARRLETI